MELNEEEIETLKLMKQEQLNKLHVYKPRDVPDGASLLETQQILNNLKTINHILDVHVNVKACH